MSPRVCVVVVFLVFAAALHTITGIVVVAVLLMLVVSAARRSGSGPASFHGHGDTRGRAWAHELRHKRVLRGLGIVVDGISVWRDGDVWAGQTTVNKSAANLRRWDALSPAEQAAVYMAGALGPGGIPTEYCSDDLAAVDARTDRATAARIAKRHL